MFKKLIIKHLSVGILYYIYYYASYYENKDMPSFYYNNISCYFRITADCEFSARFGGKKRDVVLLLFSITLMTLLYIIKYVVSKLFLIKVVMD